MSYGSFHYTDLPIVIDGLTGDGSTIYEFVIIDNENNDCSNWTALAEPVSCTSTSDCDITNLVIEAHNMCHSDGTFDVDIAFDVVNGNNSGFDLFIGDNFYAYYPEYPSTYFTIPSIAMGEGQNVVFTIQDNDNPNCYAIYTINAPNCDCHISNVVADIISSSCTNGTFAITLDFNYSNVGNDGFAVLGNGMNYGTFLYSDLPIIIDGLAGNGTSIYEFVVQDINSGSACHSWTEVQAPDCGAAADCTIQNLIVEPYNCNDDGLYSIDIDFDYTGTSTHFTLMANGFMIGTYSYNDLYLSIPNFALGDMEVVTITISDSDNNACTTSYTFTSPDCSGLVDVGLRMALQGAQDANTGNMHTNLLNNGLLPTSQPFNVFPWNYMGTEGVNYLSELPANTVDWILIQAHDANNNYLVLDRRAALLLADGSVVDIDGSADIAFNNLTNGGQYYLSVHHRNHIAVMSSSAISLPTTNPFDFRVPSNVLGGQAQLISTNTGTYALAIGDFTSDGLNTLLDFNFYLAQASMLNGYLDADANLDGSVTTADFNLLIPNMSRIGVPQVRY